MESSQVSFVGKSTVYLLNFESFRPECKELSLNPFCECHKHVTVNVSNIDVSIWLRGYNAVLHLTARVLKKKKVRS